MIQYKFVKVSSKDELENKMQEYLEEHDCDYTEGFYIGPGIYGIYDEFRACSRCTRDCGDVIVKAKRSDKILAKYENELLALKERINNV